MSMKNVRSHRSLATKYNTGNMTRYRRFEIFGYVKQIEKKFWKSAIDSIGCHSYV